MNFGQLVTRVRRPFKWPSDDSEAVQAVKDAINNAYDLVNGHRAWRMLEATTTDATTSTTETIDVDTDWRTLQTVSIADAAGATWNLDYEERSLADYLHGDPAQLTRGAPGKYLLLGAADGSLGKRKLQIILLPLPDTVYTVRQTGIVRVSHMSSNDDVPWFDATWHMMLAYFAIAELGDTQAGFDPGVVSRCRKRAEVMLEQMVWAEPDGATATSRAELVE